MHIFIYTVTFIKIALLGLLGAIVVQGYNSQYEEESTYPQFYEKLRHIKLGIVQV